MGSLQEADKAYMAGFLDGDGSLMLQVKMRADTKLGVRFMATICFYQDTRHEKPLFWIRKKLGGYLSRRRDGMTELRINGYSNVSKTLTMLRPFIRFKSKQADALMRACSLLETDPISKLSGETMRTLVELVFVIKGENYKSKSALTREMLYARLGMTP